MSVPSSPAAKPRVVLVLPVFPKLSETFVVRHFAGLLERGWDAFVLCGRSPEDAWALFPQLDRPGIRRRVRLARPTRPRRRLAYAAPAALLQCLFRRPGATLSHLARGLRAAGPLEAARQLYLDADLLLLQPDLIHFEFGTLALGRPGVGRRLGCPVAASFRGYDLNFVGLEDPDFYRPLWREAAAIHVLGEDLRRRALRRGCPPELPCAVIPPAVDAGRFPPRGERAAGPLRLLSVGRLEWKKGYEDALVAAALLRRQGLDFHWRIVGGGDFLEALAFTRHQLGLEKSVELTGALPPAAIAAELAAADLFVHAAISEGFCNAVLEAQAASVAVVCTDADGLAENVADGVSGLVVPRRQPEALAAAIAELAADEPRRRALGEAGRRRVEERFPPSAEIDAFESFYLEILKDFAAACASTSSG